MTDKEELKENIIAIIIVIVLTSLAGVWIYNHLYSAPPVQDTTRQHIALGASPTLGNSTNVTVVIFSDFECPYCGEFERNAFPQVKKDLIDTGKILFVFKEFPLDIHPHSQLAAEAALCAQDQDKFWQMHDLLYSHQDALEQQDLVGYAKQAGLNLTTFDSCMNSSVRLGDIELDKREGLDAGVSGTPTFFFNGRKVVGAISAQEFENEVAKEK